MMAQALYRPSNGTEGEYFMSVWCARCERDRARREDFDPLGGCSIICDTMAYDIGHPDYPTAWVIAEGRPICLAFEAVDADNVPLDPNAVVRPLL